MIELTKLSNEPIWLNPHLIRSVESSPDAIIALTDGTRIPVREAAAEVSRRLIHYWRSLYAQPESFGTENEAL